MQIQSRTRTALVMIGVALLACTPLWAGTARLVNFDDAGLVKVNPQVLHDGMRKVYVDQILWTRMVTLSVLDGVNGKEIYVDRLMENYEACALMTELNPKYWPEWESKILWRQYLDGTLENALARSKGDWKFDVQSYDALHLHALAMADYMSLGMQRQFAPIK